MSVTLVTGGGSADFGAQNVTTTGAYKAGATPATAGDFRLPSGGSIQARNAANTADITIGEQDASDDLYIGVDSALTGAKQSRQLKINASLFMYGMIGTTVVGVLASGSLQVGVPITGYNSAWGAVDGVATQAMPAGAATSTVAAAVVYACKVIKTTGGITANQTLVLPAATDDQGYTKIINNKSTGAFGVIVSTGAGTTVTVANAKTAMVLVDSRGVTRITADT